MANAQVNPVLQHIRKLTAGPAMAHQADGYLLDRFVTERDKAAFEILVERHGPLVLGVCRHLLRHTQDAEDAYQATFLVLARRAASIRNPNSLVSWLHGVAYRTAMKAKRDAARRRDHEMQSKTRLQADPPQEVAWREVRAVLDEEIQRLPERLRGPFVLCCVMARSHADVARQLGLKEKTVSSRLARARAKLQHRLARRGIAIATVLAATAVATPIATAAVPALLVESTVKAALVFAVRGSSNLLPANVVALAKGACKSMMVAKMKLATASFLVAGGLVAGGAFLVQASSAENPIHDQVQATPQMQASKEDQPAPRRQQSDVSKLLNRLNELRDKRGDDDWAAVLRDLIQLGPGAVPELIAELDTTHDESMLRCLAFVLRGIGDKRAIPALIRAFPKTCVAAGNDYFIMAKDPELGAFMRRLDVGDTKSGTGYSFGRAVNEFRVTLQRWTGAKHGEDEIVHVFLEGAPRQQFLQRTLYQSCAERWAKWWEAHWREFIADANYARVNLAPLVEEPYIVVGFPHGPGTKLDGRHVGHILESVRDPNAKQVFLDLDTGRVSGLPEYLRAAEGQPERFDDILAWAAREGFDLMGTEYTPPSGGEAHYVLRGLGLATWRIDTNRWKTLESELRDNQPLNMGTRTDGLLAHFDAARGRYVPEETAAFLFQTREGGYGAIFVGVEVHDDSLKVGEGYLGNLELSPTGFYKGRRFAYSFITKPVAGGGSSPR
jgi:RNA polymerase sigma factor (sigma-70 family)